MVVAYIAVANIMAGATIIGKNLFAATDNSMGLTEIVSFK
jgi:hypothetical protein